MKKLKQTLLILFFAIAAIACKKEGVNGESTTIDPFVGQWQLRAISANGQTTDVTNTECFKDSYLNVTASAGELYLSVPNPQTNKCQSERSNFQWVNENGSYYLTENGQKQQAPIQFNDNNTTLQVNLKEGILVFKKNEK